MTLRYLALGGAAAIALGAYTLNADSAVPAATTGHTLGHTMTAPAPARQTVTLDTVDNAVTALAKLRVENTAGEAVGTVTDVLTRADGKALAVSIDAGAFLGMHHRLVSIEAGKLGLDRGRHVLVVSLTKAEIKALPSLS
jgi:hypothetical protein